MFKKVRYEKYIHFQKYLHCWFRTILWKILDEPNMFNFKYLIIRTTLPSGVINKVKWAVNKRKSLRIYRL